MIDEATLRAALAQPLESVTLPGLGEFYGGKVRDNWSLADGRRVLVTTDRISAFDRVLGTIPLKGQVLSQLSAFWFERTADVAPNHLIASPDPNVAIAWECAPLPVEVVVRAYLTGVTSTSVWTAYARGEREFCGHALPDGLRKNDPLPGAIVTPSTKAPKGGHDVSVSAAGLVADGVITADDMAAVSRIALALFARGQAWCAERGLMLVDTKYEFGRLPAVRGGSIVVIDALLVCGELRRAPRAGRRARELRQGVRAALAGGAGVHRRRLDSAVDRRGAAGGRAALRRGLRAHHGSALRG
jgi:phosphoribosylaminoimidazole-succinocarboxamide synthase